MSLTMGDGPIDNLPYGLNAYAGYVNKSGIGVTYPEIVTKFPDDIHFSITTDYAPANCADVENGAMNNWKGYRYGYCEISRAQGLITVFGRPKKLWTAHHNDVPHLCDYRCGFGFTDQADATQWTDHGGLWDESLCKEDFFSEIRKETMQVVNDPSKLYIVGNAKDDGNLLVFEFDKTTHGVGIYDLTFGAGTGPGKPDPRVYQLAE